MSAWWFVVVSVTPAQISNSCSAPGALLEYILFCFVQKEFWDLCFHSSLQCEPTRGNWGWSVLSKSVSEVQNEQHDCSFFLIKAIKWSNDRRSLFTLILSLNRPCLCLADLSVRKICATLGQEFYLPAFPTSQAVLFRETFLLLELAGVGSCSPPLTLTELCLGLPLLPSVSLCSFCSTPPPMYLLYLLL